jgi:Flp pilus assembly protein TadG
MACLVRIRKALHRFRKHERGAIAVEFVLVAPIFFFLIFAILETSILYTIATVMEGEVENGGDKVGHGSGGMNSLRAA